MKKLISLVFIAACAPTGANDPGHEFQEERVHEAGQVKMTIPHGWQVNGDGDTMNIESPDHSVDLQVTVVDGSDLAATLVGVGVGMLVGYDDLALEGAPVSGQINGMNALFQDGRGKFHGEPVNLSVGLIDTPANKFLLVVGEAEPGAFEEHRHAIKHFIEDIRPL
ncbi:MAG: hypothetical protein QM831_35125 [Kofleriaceae bacterium]